MNQTFVNLAYLLASILFVLGLKRLSHPRTAVRGNLMGASGMLIAVVVTLLNKQIISYDIIIIGLIIGALIGSLFAIKVPMTKMPQLVGLFNGFGGGASVLVAGAAFIETIITKTPYSIHITIATILSGIIGSVTFFGSLIAAMKLQGVINDKPIRYKGEQFVKIIILSAVLIISIPMVLQPLETSYMYWLVAILAGILGILLTIPIGGADMPVVITLLNAYSGLAAATTGFVLTNNALIISGSLVGASGIILTNIMCKAMNRSLANVFFGGVGSVAESKEDEDTVYAGKIKSTSSEEVVMLLESARKVVIAPGYGMAVAQAQYPIRDLMNLLENNGIEVEFAIHPVAGRMPGHMNVLLAEVDIPYEKLKEMEEINPTFEQTDVTIVVGANDVVNPVANTDPNTPIAGMPILNVYKSKTVVVIKRSLSPGFAGIPNPLFAMNNTLMLFGDAKKMVQEIINALKETF